MAALTDEIREQGAKILQVINNQEQEKLAENRAAVIVQKEIGRLAQITNNQNFPAKEIEALRRELATVREQLAEPPIQKVQHHHHVPKIIVATGVLFITVCLLCCGWYNTFQKLEKFQENDTKYRLMRLDTAFAPLQHYLGKVDRVYTNNPGLRDSVIAQEEENKKNMELLLEAYRKTREAERLKSEAGKLRKAVGR